MPTCECPGNVDAFQTETASAIKSRTHRRLTACARQLAAAPGHGREGPRRGRTGGGGHHSACRGVVVDHDEHLSAVVVCAAACRTRRGKDAKGAGALTDHVRLKVRVMTVVIRTGLHRGEHVIARQRPSLQIGRAVDRDRISVEAAVDVLRAGPRWRGGQRTRREVDSVEVEDAAMSQQAAHVGVDDAPVLVEPWSDIADVHRRAGPGGMRVRFVRLRPHLLHDDEAVLVVVAALGHVGGLQLVTCGETQRTRQWGGGSTARRHLEGRTRIEPKRCEGLRVNRQLRPPTPTAGLRGAKAQVKSQALSCSALSPLEDGGGRARRLLPLHLEAVRALAIHLL